MKQVKLIKGNSICLDEFEDRINKELVSNSHREVESIQYLSQDSGSIGMYLMCVITYKIGE